MKKLCSRQDAAASFLADTLKYFALLCAGTWCLGCSGSATDVASPGSEKPVRSREQSGDEPEASAVHDDKTILFMGESFVLTDRKVNSVFSSEDYVLEGESSANWSKRISTTRYSTGREPLEKANESKRRIVGLSDDNEATIVGPDEMGVVRIEYLLWPEKRTLLRTVLLVVRSYRTADNGTHLITEEISLRLRAEKILLPELRKKLKQLAESSANAVFPATPAIPDIDMFMSSETTMPIYVMPFYDSKGPHVAVGQFNQELRTATEDNIEDVASALEAEWQTLRVETMFVLSIRTFDLGRKDDAAFWYYSALMRWQMFDAAVVSDRKGRHRLSSAFGAFGKLIGMYLHGRPLERTEQFRRNVERALAKSHELPDFSQTYPRFTFKERNAWINETDRIRGQFEQLLNPPAQQSER